jgi:uncharacterized integral membrane protein
VRTIKLFFFGLLFFLFLAFIIQNYSTLTFSPSLRLHLGIVLLESVPLPFYLLALMLFFSGLLLATLIGFFERRRLKKELRELKNNYQQLEKRLDSQPRIPDAIPPAANQASPDEYAERRQSPQSGSKETSSSS